MMNRFIQILLVLVASCSTSNAEAAAVESMSLETFKDGPQRFWEVAVSCEGASQVRLMRRPVDGDQWCSGSLPTLCDQNKFSLSRQLCNYEQVAKPQDKARTPDLGNETDLSTLQARQSAPGSKGNKGTIPPITQPTATPTLELAPSQAVNREELRKEQMQIEEQRILIDQKRLEIRRRELQLQRIQLEAGQKPNK